MKERANLAAAVTLFSALTATFKRSVDSCGISAKKLVVCCSFIIMILIVLLISCIFLQCSGVIVVQVCCNIICGGYDNGSFVLIPSNPRSG
ncbi:hypothetical protein C1H46_009727 [Malus baccata]|uniref:Uncharacterized protein n=1 Tax=Malus baccata TaxID=106549 RepID=A0A540N0U3_MALBA|nr:hypothetical protein C1H46_009727 [Malus baccata]